MSGSSRFTRRMLVPVASISLLVLTLASFPSDSMAQGSPVLVEQFGFST